MREYLRGLPPLTDGATLQPCLSPLGVPLLGLG
jgi:hypothetical protein